MAGNLPVTLTTFETELQAKINTVGSGTSIEDIISYYRAGENIPTINNTALTDEVQLRLNSVSSSTTAEEFLTLAASFGKISNTNQSDLQSALLAIADIPTNSELATALNPIATSADLAPLAKSSELIPLATSTNVSDSEANILSQISSKSSGVFNTGQILGQSSVLLTTASPLILSPPAGKVIRLDWLSLIDTNSLNIQLKVGGNTIYSGALGGDNQQGIIISNIATGSSQPNINGSTKQPILSLIPDAKIEISNTSGGSRNMAYSVSYGSIS